MAIEEFTEEISELGTAMDENIAVEAETLTPEGTYTTKGLNTLVSALNEVLPMFQLPDYPEFGEEIMGPLPEEFVRQLMMVSSAAESAGLEPLDMTDASDDRGLEILAGHLKNYARDRGFKQFVESQVMEMDFEEPEEEVIEEEEVITPDEDIETDSLFVERMR